MKSVSFAPSILSADFSKLKEEIKSVEEVADYIHVDVMDGHFVPNISIGPVVSNSLKRLKEIRTPFSIHLMITDPDKYASEFEVNSEDLIIFHSEVTDNPRDMIEKVRGLGCQVGISQKPGGDLGEVLPVLTELDEVLVMGVEPGFGGQKFMPEALERIEILRREINNRRLDTAVAVDGGMNPSTVGEAVDAGADTIIAGSAVFGKEDRVKAVKELRKAVQ